MDDFFSFLGKIAPTVASYVGTPAAGVAIEALLSAFDGDEEKVNAIIKGEASLSSDDIARIKLAEIAAKQRSEEIGLEYAKIAGDDVKSARDRDTEIIKSGKRNIRADLMVLAAMLLVLFLVYIVWTTPDISEFVKGVVTLLLGRFLGYIDSAYGFEFSTTRGSQNKDESIKALSIK